MRVQSPKSKVQSRNEIEILARGVLVRGGHLLVCHNRKKENTFLPGGHVEWGEGAKEALRREMLEETGLRFSVGRFLGACEHAYAWKGRRVCEINLVFEMRTLRAQPPRPVPSCEKKLQFTWLPLAKLKTSRLEPRVLSGLLAGWAVKPCDRWASTL